MGIIISNLTPKDINIYKQYEIKYYKTRNNFNIGDVVNINDNLSHDHGYSGQQGIIVSLSGLNYYTYVIAYNSIHKRYHACGFDECDLQLSNVNIYDTKELYVAFENYLINNKFALCTRDFKDFYMSKNNLRRIK